jgi:hypothetical protein
VLGDAVVELQLGQLILIPALPSDDADVGDSTIVSISELPLDVGAVLSGWRLRLRIGSLLI